MPHLQAAEEDPHLLARLEDPSKPLTEFRIDSKGRVNNIVVRTLID